MQGGLFIALYDEQTLKLYLNKGVYGFLMKPVFTETLQVEVNIMQFQLIMLVAERAPMYSSF